MKLSILSDLQTKAAAHKKITLMVCVLLVVLTGAGIYYGWQQYLYRQTSAYAFEELKKALNPPVPAELAKLVDFNSISNDLALAIQKNFPFFLAGPDQERNIRHLLQTALLKRFMSKEEAVKAKPEEISEEEQLKKELQILPPDFVGQLVQGLTLRETDSDTALISSKIENPQLKRSFTIVFGMRKTSDGWKVRNVANASEVVSQLRAAMLERHVKLRNVYLDKNSATTKRMNQLLPIQSCSADAGLLSDGKTLLLVVHVIARNKGNLQVNNFNLDTAIYGRSGQLVLRRYLNAAKPVGPGEDFNHRWNFELEADSEPGRSILRNEPLQCRAAWQTLGLNSAEVLHIVDVPNPDRQCSIAGHDHPDGFCQTPVFLQ